MDEVIMYKRSKRLREFVTSFHLGFMFIGLFILSIGAYLINSNVSRTVSIFLMVLGGLVTTTAFIGCFGATLEHTGFLNTCSSIIAITLIVQLILIGLTYARQPQLDTYASSTWTFFKEKDPDFLLDIEQTLKCCGYASTTDRALPNNCSNKFNTSCKDTIMTLVDQWHQWLLVLILSTLVIELFSLVISVILAFIMDRETKEEETYMAVLASQHNPPWFSENSRGLARHRSSFTQRSIPKYGSTPSTRT